MNIFEVWFGADLFDFEKPFQNYRHSMNVNQHTIDANVQQAREFVKDGRVLWSMCVLIEFNPETGEKTVTTWHEKGTPKERLILNPKAKTRRPSRSLPIAWPDDLGAQAPAHLDEMHDEEDDE